jgi:signal transduction histidine kinase
MLHDFILENRDRIIERTQQRLKLAPGQPVVHPRLEHGIPLFLSQLVDALIPAAALELHLVDATDAARADANQRITESAALHGRDLLKHGLTVGQVVHGYGDVCQVVTQLAGEEEAAISPEDFHRFNRCLDDAIAGAVTAYSNQRERELGDEGTERLGAFAHELRNLLGTAILSFDAIKSGTVGLSGSTGGLHARSLSRLRALVERSLAEVRLRAGNPVFENISVADFMEEVELTARLHAEGCGLHLTVTTVEPDVCVEADQQLLMSAIINLLQNALKFTRLNGSVSVVAQALPERVLFSVVDECGGLPPGQLEELFRPFTRGNLPHPGLGLGLSIAQAAARANRGDIGVTDVPGTGCVFTIDLPRSLC